MNPVATAIGAKGLSNYLRRGQAIVKSYGPTPSQMARSLEQFGEILAEFRCGATFPVTAAVVRRNRRVIEGFRARGVEFAIHGYQHIDHSKLTFDELAAHLRRAREIFAAAGIPAVGFRPPYLRFNEQLRTAAKQSGLGYISSQPIIWDLISRDSVPPSAVSAYRRAIAFYQPWTAGETPSLPWIDDDLVEIPIALPDDEILLDRLDGAADGLMGRVWSRILTETYEREELFTLQLHPERISRCASSLSSLLARARDMDPPVWVARLDEISAWWRDRAKVTIKAERIEDNELCLGWTGPAGITVLARNVAVQGHSHPWARGYRQCDSPPLVLKTNLRPFIGVPPSTDDEQVNFLRQLGHIVEKSHDSHSYSVYLDQPVSRKESSSLTRIEECDRPLVRLGRWPGGARSALAITGDIDALTLWDYGLRFLGR